MFFADHLSGQTMWNTLFPNGESEKLEIAYQKITSDTNSNIPFEQLKDHVKILNDYALLHFPELNDEFQKKIINHLASTDSMELYNKPASYSWWQSKFLHLSEVMPVFVIQQQMGKFSKPNDTLEIKVPGTDKVISVIVNNKIIEGYLLSQHSDNLISEQDLRHLYTNDVYDLIAFYRTGKLPAKGLKPDDLSEGDGLPDVKHEPDATASISNEDESSANKQVKDGTANRQEAIEDDLPPADLSKGIAYRIQIAAAHNPLSEKELNGRYQGNRSKKHFRENGWIKYYVAELPTLDKARKIVQEEGMPRDAFIMAYKNGQKAPEYLRNTFGRRSRNFKDLAPLTYDTKIWVVQIAADQKPLSLADINNKYGGNKPVYYINEGAWHRYSIGAFDSFSAADDLRQTCGVPDAFIAAYLNGHRLDSWSVNQKKLSGEPIKYIVQVAASFKKLPDEELKNRYAGDSAVMHFQENGYHKYAIGHYDTFKEALKAREESGVPDAFIKAYQGAKKVSLFKAKNITDKN